MFRRRKVDVNIVSFNTISKHANMFHAYFKILNFLLPCVVISYSISEPLLVSYDSLGGETTLTQIYSASDKDKI